MPHVWCRCFDLHDLRKEAQNLFGEAADLIVNVLYIIID